MSGGQAIPDKPAAKHSASGDLTIKDIARMAGVSVSTVSRVINNTGLVTESKLERVNEVLARVNYIPNNSARALVRRRTMSAGLIIPTLSNPLFAPTIAGVERVLAQSGYGLLLACSDREPAKEFAHARTMIERGVDGIILTGSYRHPELLPLMASRGVVAVSQDDPIGAEGLTSIPLPDADAMGCAIDALCAHGHRRIGIITGPTGNTPPIRERVRGAVARLAHHGISHGPDDLVEVPDYSAEKARAATRSLLKRRPDLTAIACTGDILAIGVISECRRMGLGVPGDISVIGCGETVMAQFVDPKLSTVRLPFEELGAVAASELLALIGRSEEREAGPLHFELVEGATVASAVAGPGPD